MMVSSTLAKATKTGITAIMAGAMLTGSSIAYAQNADSAGDPAASTPAPPVTSAPEATASSENPVNPLYGNINPFYGNISPFWGTINPFYGNIEPFWGTINPFYGNIQPFWGTINPFTQDANSVAPAWGTIQPFWSDVDKKWSEALGKWNEGDANPSSNKYNEALKKIFEIEKKSADVWGDVVNQETGLSFAEGFVDPLFAKYGIDRDDPDTLAQLDPATRQQFFLDWFDGLMNLSGTDRVDHWMQTANWTPSITQQQGSGEHTVIGIIDANISGDIDLEDNIISQTGFQTSVAGHGIGVASLIVAAHDGSGIMGLAPNAKVALHNPFDESGTTNWNDIRSGIQELKQRDASIINLSLGVPGYTFSPEWVDVLGDSSIRQHRNDTVYVFAAGNDGVTQTQDVEWGSAIDTNFLVVGSVDPAGNISTFSNRPGEACLVTGGFCNTSSNSNFGGKLKDRFLVAPGELLLVSDGQGGTVRRTGTSFAAPLVSGAIALLHDRWPWLTNHPEETVDIILGSAQDLGAPGVDEVYGAGLLDITASQSPLDFNDLRFYEERNGSYIEHSVASLQAAGVQSTWETEEVHFVLYENIGDTARDFAVPLSSLVSGSMTTYYGAQQQYQNFLTQGLTDFIGGGSAGTGALGFTDVAQYTTPDRGGWQMSIAAANPTAYLTGEAGDVPHSAIRAAAPGSKLGFTAGHGYGAMALTSEGGFGLSTDYATDSGVNPLLALASGGSFFATDYSLSKATKVSLGYTSRDEAAIDNPAYRDTSRLALLGRENYKAGAMNLRVTHQASKNVSLSVNYTRLHEDNALLAVQAENGLLRDGSNSETLTFSGTAQLPEQITVSASATAGRTKTAGSDQILSTSNGGVMTSAFALTATKNAVLGSRDRLRLSVSQPMHIERGELQLASAEIVDRATGEIGTVNRSFGIDQNKRLITGEMIYAAPLAGDAGEVSFFGRATMGDETDERSGIVAGARLSLEF